MASHSKGIDLISFMLILLGKHLSPLILPSLWKGVKKNFVSGVR
jgi:hypothetical protein